MMQMELILPCCAVGQWDINYGRNCSFIFGSLGLKANEHINHEQQKLSHIPDGAQTTHHHHPPPLDGDKSPP